MAEQDELNDLTLLTGKIRNLGIEGIGGHKDDCYCLEIAITVSLIASDLRSTSYYATTLLYDRPLRLMLSDLKVTLEKTLSLVSSCKHHRIFLLRPFLFSTPAAKARNIFKLLNSCRDNSSWLQWVCGTGAYYRDPNIVPPIAGDNPALHFIWSSIIRLELRKENTSESVNALHTLAREGNEWDKVTLIEEKAVEPLMRVLKDSGEVLEVRIAAAETLCCLVDGRERSIAVVGDVGGVRVILHVLHDSDELKLKLKVVVAELVAKISEVDELAREEFGREGVLETLLSFLGNINGMYENETPEMKYKAMEKCSLALWRLCKGCAANVQKIVEFGGMLFMKNFIEGERAGMLRFYCLMVCFEVANVVVEHADRWYVTWKPSDVVDLVLEELVQLIDKRTVELRVATINAIGYMSVFVLPKFKIIRALIRQLEDLNLSKGG